MSDSSKERLKRLERLLQIRETYVSVSEANVKLAEGEVRKFATAEETVAGQIRDTKAEIAYLKSATAHDVQSSEKYISALQSRRKQIQQALEKADRTLEQRRNEWTEAMREKKIIEKMQEHRLQEWQHEDDVAKQNSQDENTIARYVRTRLKD
jgi:flagellar export protein FliJ